MEKKSIYPNRKLLFKEWMKALSIWLGLYGGVVLFWYPIVLFLQQMQIPKGFPLGVYITSLAVLGVMALCFIGYNLKNLWKQHHVGIHHLVILTIIYSLGALAWLSLSLVALMLGLLTH